jgi:ribosomal protein S18 acetylase RimI-like enzyme
VYWVAEAGGEIVAHVCVQYVKKIPKPQRLHNAYGYVTNVYTKPKFRGQGIASELLRRVKSWAREHDLEFLITWPSEQGAALYERAGFVKENEALQCPLRPDSA